MLPSPAALKQEASDTDRRARPAGEEPSELLEVDAQLAAALDGRGHADDAGVLVERKFLVAAEVDQQGIVAHTPHREAVSAGPYADLPAAFSGQPNAFD